MSQFVGEEFVTNARRHRYRRRRVRIKSIQNASAPKKKSFSLCVVARKKSTRTFFTTFNNFLVNFPSANGEAIAHTGLSVVSSSSSPGVDGTGNPSRPRFFDDPRRRHSPVCPHAFLSSLSSRSFRRSTPYYYSCSYCTG